MLSIEFLFLFVFFCVCVCYMFSCMMFSYLLYIAQRLVKGSLTVLSFAHVTLVSNEL